MSVEFKVDDSEFSDTLRKYLSVSTRSLSEALNQKMFFIVRGAVRGLPKVEKSKIENEIVSGYNLKFTKRGKIASGRQQGRASSAIANVLVYKIINARRKFAGKPGLTRDEMKEKSARFIAARFRSVGTLKAGWWGALRKLREAVGATLAFGELSTNRIKNPSTAQIASPGWNPGVSVEYNLQAHDEHYQRGIDKRVAETFSAAWFEEMRSMREHIESKLATDLVKVSRPSRQDEIVLQPPIRTPTGFR